MNKAQMKEAIERTAKETGVSEIELISQAQAGAAVKGDEAALDLLCDIKNDYIEALI